MLDGIVEANANPVITYDVDGRTHHLKWWDSGGHVPNAERLEVFVEDTKRCWEHTLCLVCPIGRTTPRSSTPTPPEVALNT